LLDHVPLSAEDDRDVLDTNEVTISKYMASAGFRAQSIC
jgi:hypothetical protein